MSTRVVRERLAHRGAAAMPSIPGISTSSSATSGRCSGHGRQHLVAGRRPRRRPRGRARGRAAPTARRAPGPGRRPAAAGWGRAHPTATRRTCPWGGSTRVVTVPPTAAARSRRPVRPLPACARRRAPAARRPAAVVDDLGARPGSARTVQRRRAAVPDHVGDALAHRPGEQLAQVRRDLVGGVGQLGLDLGGLQRRPGPGQLAGQGQLAVALDGAAYVGQRVAREPLEVGELGPGPLGVDVEQPVARARP